jgi:glycosyltransferase involved in cell wall biosynthesis
VRDAISAEVPKRRHQIDLIPNPIDTEVFNPGLGRSFDSDVTTIVYAGRVHPEKGVHILVEAFAQLLAIHPKLRLRIVGPVRVEHGGGGLTYEQRLRACAKATPVELIGPIWDASGLANELRQGDIFCYPSLAASGETFGVAVAEAMACGLVPVVSDLPCFADFVTDSTTGFVFRRNSKDPAAELARKLSSIIERRGLAREVRFNAIERARLLDYKHISKAFDRMLMAADDAYRSGHR